MMRLLDSSLSTLNIKPCGSDFSADRSILLISPTRWERSTLWRETLFTAAFPFAENVLDLPVEDLDHAATYYARAFGLTEVERQASPPTVIMERDGVRLGFSINRRDPGQEGAAILVSDIRRARDELESSGIEVGNWRIDVRDGKKFQVFFVVAPDGLCYYFHQPIDASGTE
jgi:hypothetical protein